MRQIILRTTSSLLLFLGICSLTLGLSTTKAISSEPNKQKTPVGSNSDSDREPTAKKPQFPDRGIPTGRRRGGTSRSECPGADKVVTAIVPGKELAKISNSHQSDSFKFAPHSTFENSESFLTQTLEEYPSFWLYVPQAPNLASRGEFILQDDRDRDIYRGSFKLPNKSGILKIQLPAKRQNALKVGQKYHWYVKVFCNGEREGEYIFVDAWIERATLTPKIEQQLRDKNTSEYQVYVDNNIWHDAIDNLAEIRQTNSHNNLELDRWNQLLSNLGLSDLMDKKMLDIRANFLEE